MFDLTKGGPQPAIELFRRVPKVKLLACGGDGTVGWLLSVLDRVNIDPAPPVSVLPLGTGNDLSRSLGEGEMYIHPHAWVLHIHGELLAPLSKFYIHAQKSENVTLMQLPFREWSLFRFMHLLLYPIF